MKRPDDITEMDKAVKAYHLADTRGKVLKDNPNMVSLCNGLGIDLATARIQNDHTQFDSPMEGAMLSFALDRFLSSMYSMDTEAQYGVHKDGTLSIFVKEGNKAVYRLDRKDFQRLCPALPIHGHPVVTLVPDDDKTLLIFIWRNLGIHEISKRQADLFASCFSGLKEHLNKIAGSADLENLLTGKKTQDLFYTAIGSFVRSVVDKPFTSNHTKSRRPVWNENPV